MCKNHLRTEHFVPIPPLVEEDNVRSMSVVPYINDLYNTRPGDVDHELSDQYEESNSAGNVPAHCNNVYRNIAKLTKMKVLFSSFPKNVHAAWFDPQTKKLESICFPVERNPSPQESECFISCSDCVSDSVAHDLMKTNLSQSHAEAEELT